MAHTSKADLILGGDSIPTAKEMHEALTEASCIRMQCLLRGDSRGMQAAGRNLDQLMEMRYLMGNWEDVSSNA